MNYFDTYIKLASYICRVKFFDQEQLWCCDIVIITEYCKAAYNSDAKAIKRDTVKVPLYKNVKFKISRIVLSQCIDCQ